MNKRRRACAAAPVLVRRLGRGLDQRTDRGAEQRAKASRGCPGALEGAAEGLGQVQGAFLADYQRQVDEDRTTAYIALEEVERIDRERAEQEQLIAEAEAVVNEWSEPANVDAILDYYSELRDLVQGRIKQAEGAAELNKALGQLLAGLWVEVEEDRERILASFELTGSTEYVLPGGVPDPFRQRPSLPPRHLDDRTELEPLALVEPGPGRCSRSDRN